MRRTLALELWGTRTRLWEIARDLKYGACGGRRNSIHIITDTRLAGQVGADPNGGWAVAPPYLEISPNDARGRTSYRAHTLWGRGLFISVKKTSAPSPFQGAGDGNWRITSKGQTNFTGPATTPSSRVTPKSRSDQRRCPQPELLISAGMSGHHAALGMSELRAISSQRPNRFSRCSR
jgi:hypothetical protein